MAPVEVSARDASKKQIHAAIELEARGEVECATTLAAAAEGMLPNTDNEHFRAKVKALAATLPEATEGATGPNDVITWLKHGTYNGHKCDKATIDDVEAPAVIWRAITKWHAVYDEFTPEMKAWAAATRDRLAAEKRQSTDQAKA